MVEPPTPAFVSTISAAWSFPKIFLIITGFMPVLPAMKSEVTLLSLSLEIRIWRFIRGFYFRAGRRLQFMIINNCQPEKVKKVYNEKVFR